MLSMPLIWKLKVSHATVCRNFLQVSQSWHLTFSTLKAGTGKTLRHDMTVNRIFPTFETCLNFSVLHSNLFSYLSLDLLKYVHCQITIYKKNSLVCSKNHGLNHGLLFSIFNFFGQKKHSKLTWKFRIKI
jgi:hypothetical protein